MYQILASLVVGMSLLLGIPASAAEDSRTIMPGGCVLQTIEINGKLICEWVPADWLEPTNSREPRLPIARFRIVWKVVSNGKSWELDFGSNQKLQKRAEQLQGQMVRVTGTQQGDQLSLRVTGLQADGQVAVEIKGKLQQDLTEILRPYNVSWYIPVGGQRYYLDFGGNRKLEELATTCTGSVIVTGQLEVSGRFLIVHVHGVKPEGQTPSQRTVPLPIQNMLG